MKVLGVVGGPRRTGNTARLVEEVLAGARDAGHETHVFYLAEMELGPLGHDGQKYEYPEDGFYVERAEKVKRGYTAYTHWATLGPNATAFTDSVASAGTYKYRVQAFKSAAVSEYSNEVSVRTREPKSNPGVAE